MECQWKPVVCRGQHSILKPGRIIWGVLGVMGVLGGGSVNWFLCSSPQPPKMVHGLNWAIRAPKICSKKRISIEISIGKRWIHQNPWRIRGKEGHSQDPDQCRREPVTLAKLEGIRIARGMEYNENHKRIKQSNQIRNQTGSTAAAGREKKNKNWEKSG